MSREILRHTIGSTIQQLEDGYFDGEKRKTNHSMLDVLFRELNLTVFLCFFFPLVNSFVFLLENFMLKKLAGRAKESTYQLFK